MDKHDTLLIACGTAEHRSHLRGVLGQRYNLLEAGNAQQTLLLLRQNLECIAALVLDISDPKTLDVELLTRMEYEDLLHKVPTIVIAPRDGTDVVNTAFGSGAADVIPIGYEPYAMLRRIETIVELHLHKQYLETLVQEQATLLRQSNDTLVDALSSIIEYRSVESGQHILRIRHFTRILLEEVARSCPEYGLDDRVIAIISSASALHDIGKIAIPDSILMKPGKLTQQEREAMKAHAITGCRILDTIRGVADQEYLRYAHNICHYHHERWDGGGYPEGLAGEAIPICAQVVGIADVYDALTTKRVYKDAYSFAHAVNMILRGECGIFSPKLLECFKHVTKSFEELARAYADGSVSPKQESFDLSLPAPAAREENSVERVRAKYSALVHYINGLLMEVDLNQDLFHLIYNPYPELSWIREVSAFSDMLQLLNERVVDQEGRSKMMGVFREGIRSFMEQDLRRVTHNLRFCSKQRPEGDAFEVTLLRINPIDASRQTLAILCRRIRDEAMARPGIQEVVPTISDSTFVCRNDEHFTLVKFGAHVPMLAGYSREELKVRFGNRMMELVLPEDREKLRRSFREQLIRGTSAEAEFRVRRKDGKVIWVLDKSRLTIGADGQEYLSAMLSDITASKREFDALNDKLRRYEIILAQTENVLFDWDMETDKITFSDTWEKMFGKRPVNGSVWAALREGSYFHPDDLPLLLDSLGKLEAGSHYEMAEVRMVSVRGRYLWVRVRANAIRNKQGILSKIVGILINIDAEKQAARALQERAERDSLTRLLNKNAARKQAEEYLARYPQGAECAMLIIDLDNFKQVNDRFGHLFGDTVLTRVSREISKLFREQDIVARIGGDEFLVLMRGVSQRNLLESRCQRLLNIFSGIFQNGKQNLPLSCSIGIALSPEHGTSYYELFNRADQALYRAKARGKNGFSFYDPTEQFPAQASGTAVNNHIDSDEEPGLAEDNLVRYAFQRLYSAEDVESAINEILALVGRKTNVSRVYVFENTDDDRFCNNTYEWCNEGIPPEIGMLQNISYETDIPGYADNFDEQGIFYCPDVAILPQAAYDIVAAQGIKSMLQCAIREGGKFRGYIGFDECVEQRMWTKEQIQLLTYFAEMLAVFLLKRREQEKALEQAREMTSLLDNQNAWIYIIDPETCELKYLNAKTKELVPDVRPGMRCYKALMGKEERCPGCPALGIREKKNNNAIMYNDQFDLKTLADATAILWDRQDSCLVTCREIPKEG